MPLLSASLSPFEMVLTLGTGLSGRSIPDGCEAVPLWDAAFRDPARREIEFHEMPREAQGLSLEGAATSLVAQVEELEAERARLDARLVEAYGALHTVFAQLHTEHEAQLPAGMPRESPARAAISIEQLVVQEVSLAAPVPEFEVSRRLELARSPRRHRPLLDRLAAGEVSLLHATMIGSAVRDLPDERVEPITERVLAPMADGSRPTHRVITRRLRRAIVSAAGSDAGGRRTSQLHRRDADGQLTEDGTGVVTITTSAERTVAILERLEALSRAMRAAGDPRTLAQLRSDLATDALLGHAYGPCAEHGGAVDGGFAPCLPMPAPPIGAGTSEMPTEGLAGRTEGLAGPTQGLGPCGCAPSPPPATVWIVVPFEVATGASVAACEIPGHGWVTAPHAREIITAEGSEWRWLGVDSVTGRALELGTDRYRPTRAMIEQIRALDGHCRAPGCQVPAHRCDLDHHVPHPLGPTTTGNLGALHRRHHNLKTSGFWACTPMSDPELDRGLHWRTTAGREYLTLPKDYREALADPPSDPSTGPVPERVPERSPERSPATGPATETGPAPEEPPPF